MKINIVEMVEKQMAGSLIVGILALLGALLVINWGYNYFKRPVVTAQVSQGAPVVVTTADGAQTTVQPIIVTPAPVAGAPSAPIVVMPPSGPTVFQAPCMAPPLPSMLPITACGCPAGVAGAPAFAGPSRNDLFPGSYVVFGLENTGCLGDLRNRRC